MNNNTLVGLGFNEQVRFYINDTTKEVEKINKTFMPSPVCAAILGRTFSITSIMGLMMKNNSDITTIINGDGPAGQVICVSEPSGKTRISIQNPYVDIPLKENKKLDVSGAIGKGSLQVIKNYNLKEPYNGQVSLISGEIAQDFTYYFASSEQVPTAISAGVLVGINHEILASGAFVIQLLPNASEETIDLLEERFSKIGNLSSRLDNNESLEDIIKIVFEQDYKILSEQNVSYECNCSEDKFIESISLLGDDEIKDMKNEESIECVCNFCNKKYNIKTDKL